MAAVRLDEERIWKVPNWVYRGVMEEILAYLNPEGELANNIKESMDSNNQFSSFVGLSLESIREFHEASQRGLEAVLSKGSPGFAQPKFFQAFVNQFRDLQRLRCITRIAEFIRPSRLRSSSTFKSVEPRSRNTSRTSRRDMTVEFAWNVTRPVHLTPPTPPLRSGGEARRRSFAYFRALAAATCSFATATTLSGVKPNFFCSSLSGAEAPKVCIPIVAPL